MNNLDLWTQGTPVSSAVLEFSPPELLKRYNRKRLPPKRPLLAGTRMLVDSLAQNVSDPLALEEAFAGMGQAFSGAKDRFDTYREMVADLLERISRGELIAIGYLRKDGLNGQPSIIHARFAEARYFKVEKDIVAIPDAVFEFVRIVPCPLSPSIPGEQKLGRPETRSHIIKAMLDLYEEGHRFDGPQKRHVLLIQKKVQANTEGLVDPAERTVLRYFQEGKAAIAAAKKR